MVVTEATEAMEVVLEVTEVAMAVTEEALEDMGVTAVKEVAGADRKTQGSEIEN